MTLELARPWALALLALLPAWWLVARGRGGAVTLGRASLAAATMGGRGARIASHLPNALRGLGFAALVVALAGPRTAAAETRREAEGIAVMLALDVSSSMLAQDFRPSNRLEVAKATIARFVRGRPDDRLGLVTFAGEALTQVPATGDHDLLLRAVERVEWGHLGSGTAVGMGLATAVNRLRALPGEGKVIVLMSDGANTAGTVQPRDAARAAAALGIRVYAIGVGSTGLVRAPVERTASGFRYAMVPARIDRATLGEVARVTGGRYFEATDADALRRVYAEIDRLERTPVTVTRRVRRTDLALPFVLAAAALLLAEAALRASRWGRLP